MKNKIFTLFVFLLIGNMGFAQQHVCGVSHEDQLGMISFIDALNKNPQSTVRSSTPVFVPIKFHMTSNNDGTGRIKAAKVLDQMTVLNNAYKELGMYLYIDDNSFNYLNSTSIYNNPGNFVNTIIGQKVSDAVNIFITENANPPGSDSDAGVVLGFYNPNGDYIIIRNQDVQNTTSSLTHELGHFFSLPHTFFGWESVYAFYGWVTPQGGIAPWNVDQFNGMWTSNTAGGSTVPAEVMDQSNCTTAADKICDTPPDYNFGLGQNSCSWPNTLRDRNGDVIDPQENNIMSYFGGCDFVFSQGQIDVMMTNYNSGARSHLRKTYVPDTTEIISNHELIEPAENASLEYYTNVLLDWSDADGASNYLVSINTGSGDFFEYFVDESRLLLEELEPNTFYFWDVQPYNDGNTDATKQSSFFLTGSEINTSVTESEIIQNVNIYPNPGQRGEAINISLDMEENGAVNISVHDITGRLIDTQNQNLTFGNNTFQLDGIFESGLYFMKLETKDGSIQKKFVVR